MIEVWRRGKSAVKFGHLICCLGWGSGHLSRFGTRDRCCASIHGIYSPRTVLPWLFLYLRVWPREIHLVRCR